MRTVLIIVASMAPRSAMADPAADFGRFWGAALAIEERCPHLAVRTDAIMGSHLNAADYHFAKSMVDRERGMAIKLVDAIGCDRAADEAVKLSGKSWFEVWQIVE